MGEMAGALAGVGAASAKGATAASAKGATAASAKGATAASAKGANGIIQNWLVENEADINSIKHESSQMLKNSLQNHPGYDHKNKLAELMNFADSQNAQAKQIGEAANAESLNNAMASHERAKAEMAELMKMSQNSAQNNMG